MSNEIRSAYSTQGNSLGRNFGPFALGSNVLLKEQFSLFAGYDLQIADRYTAHMGLATVQYRW